MQLSLFPTEESKLIKIKYPIVRIEFTDRSYSWANGLYIQIGNDYSQLDFDGKPYIYEDGTFMITCSGTENKLIFNTGLFYEC